MCFNHGSNEIDQQSLIMDEKILFDPNLTLFV